MTTSADAAERRSVARAPELSGAVLDGRYELRELIGEGSFGRVFRGYDRRLARPVAVKVIKPWWAEDPEWARAFEREAQLLASLSHDGIVAVYDVGDAPEGLYLVSELVEGGSLARRLAQGSLPAAEARTVALELCRALGGAHARRVVHRDVKPENVLLTADGRVKVGDFGIARLAESTTDAPAGTIIGTPRYMAPEQARGGPITPATDVYAVGVVLYEMLAGHPPFAGSSAVELALRHLSDPPPALGAAVPPRLAAIALRALAKDPAERFADAAAMARALQMVDTEAQTLTIAPRGPAPVPAAAVPPRLPAAARPGEPTRIGDPRSRRRNVNPAERRQRAALLMLVLGLIGGLAAAAALLAPTHVRVPTLTGLDRAQAQGRLRRSGLRGAFVSRYSAVATGRVIAQRPAARASVESGDPVTVVLSAGPPPVRVPALIGTPAAVARTRLTGLGLHAALTAVPAPGATTGDVVAQRPAAGERLRRGSTLSLQVAAVPQWRPLTSVSGSGSGSSVPFRIRGAHWRLVITMAYQGTCTFIFFCNGPSAQVVELRTGRTVDSFDLGTGTAQSRVEASGPGVYGLRVSAGSDTARWRIGVEDRF
jgi:serine/threonine-protein kinase